METGRGRAILWFIQRITGLILGFGVVFHFIMFHYLGYKVGVTYFEARDRLISPGWIALYTVLLGMAIFHGMNGLWGIFLDFNLGPKTKQYIKSSLYILGAFLFIFGLFILIRFNTLVMSEV